MGFKITDRKRRAAAFTLAETLVAAGISSMVLLAMASFSSFSGRSFAAMGNYADLDNRSRGALDRMSRDIRQCDSLSSYTSNSAIRRIILNDFDGLPLTYTFDVNARTLSRIKNGTTTTCLTECDSLDFGIYQRTPMGGAFEQFPTATAASCKVIQVRWICSRTIMGNKVNTESVQSAKVVIRRK